MGHHEIANLENKLSTEIDEIQEEANSEQVVDRKSVLLKALEESGALESERLTIINKEFEDMEEAARRNRHVQLGKLKERMKNRRKVRENELAIDHEELMEQALAEGPDKEV